jgi:hypothetical protein
MSEHRASTPLSSTKVQLLKQTASASERGRFLLSAIAGVSDPGYGFGGKSAAAARGWAG